MHFSKNEYLPNNGGLKMKTNFRNALITACVAMAVSGSNVLAQSDPDNVTEEVSSALERLELLMSTFENNIRYTAPETDNEVGVQEAILRLELFADQAEDAMKYRAPEGHQYAESLYTAGNEVLKDEIELLTENGNFLVIRFK